MWNQKPCFRFEIDNFSEKKGAIPSHSFVSGGCEWYLYLQPKGDGLSDDRLALFLAVANHKSLQTGWKRSANFYFSVLDQSDKELYRSPIVGQGRYLFCAQSPALGFITTLPTSKFQEKGFLKKDRLVIKVFIKIVEAVDGEGGDVSKKDEIVDTIDSKDYASQVTLVRKIFAEHPEIAEEFKPKNQVLNMNILRNACSKFSELAEVGFKLDWLKSKLGEFSLETKKADDELGDSPLENKKADDELGEAPLENKKADDELRSRVQHLEDRIKNHELDRIKNHELMQSDYKVNYLKSKLEEFSLGRKKSYDADGSRVQQLEKRVKNLELMESGFKMDCLKSQLEEISLERKKSYDVDGSRVQQLEERVKNLELIENGLRLDSLKSKLEEVSLEKKKSYDVDGSRVQQLEERVKNLALMENGLRLDSLKSKLEEVSLEKKKANADGSQVHQLEDRVKNLELMVSDLKVELDKEKARSSADGFLLVEEVA